MTQVMYTIELRVDFKDAGKKEPMKKAVQHAARHALAVAALLSDGVKPQIACFSDDFFSGHNDIELLGDLVAQGEQQIGAEAEEVSDELIRAATATTK